MSDLSPKPLIWIGSTRDDLREFPEEVRGFMGHALFMAQCGLKHEQAKPLKGLWRRRGTRNRGGLRRRRLPCGLHGAIDRPCLRPARVSEEIEAWQRDSARRSRPNSLATQARCATACRMAANAERNMIMTSQIKATQSSGNVFADLGLKNPEERLAKAELAV